MRQLGHDYLDYWKQFETMYETAVQAAFGGPAPWAGLKGSSMYLTETLVASATAGYELEVSPAEAMGLMVLLEAYVFRENHGTISRVLRPSLRERARDHNSMLKVVSLSVIPLRQQPIINAFAERVTHHLKQGGHHD